MEQLKDHVKVVVDYDDKEIRLFISEELLDYLEAFDYFGGLFDIRACDESIFDGIIWGVECWQKYRKDYSQHRARTLVSDISVGAQKVAVQVRDVLIASVQSLLAYEPSEQVNSGWKEL